MFRSLSYIFVFVVFFLTSSHALAACVIPAPTKINVIPKSGEVVYDTSKTQAQMAAVNVDTINPYGFDTHSHVQGFSSGGIDLRHSVKLGYAPVMNNQGACIWYESIDITLSISPHITIASELLSNQCRFDAVKEHELKHVNVDRIVVNNAAQSIGKNVHNALKSRGFIVGPVAFESAQDIADRMQHTVGQIMEFELKKLEVERAEKQQAVDSLEEYQRVSSLCTDSSSAIRGR